MSDECFEELLAGGCSAHGTFLFEAFGCADGSKGADSFSRLSSCCESVAGVLSFLVSIVSAGVGSDEIVEPGTGAKTGVGGSAEPQPTFFPEP